MTELPTVLDASAVLAAIQRELGWERVMAAIDADKVYVSAVNMSEVFTKLVQQKLADPHIAQVLGRLRVSIEPFTAEDAQRAGALSRHTRAVGLALGDRACLALASRLSAVALTADRVWAKLDVGIAIELIR